MGFEKHVVEYLSLLVFIQIGAFPNKILVRVSTHQVDAVGTKFTNVVQVKLERLVVLVLGIICYLASTGKELSHTCGYVDVAFTVGAVETHVQVGPQFRQEVEFVIQYHVANDPAHGALVAALVEQCQGVAWSEGIGIFGGRIQKFKITAQGIATTLDGLSRIKHYRRANRSLVGKTVVDRSPFQVHIYFEVFVKKRRVDAQRPRQTVHVAGFEDTVLVHKTY